MSERQCRKIGCLIFVTMHLVKDTMCDVMPDIRVADVFAHSVLCLVYIMLLLSPSFVKLFI